MMIKNEMLGEEALANVVSFSRTNLSLTCDNGQRSQLCGISGSLLSVLVASLSGFGLPLERNSGTRRKRDPVYSQFTSIVVRLTHKDIVVSDSKEI